MTRYKQHIEYDEMEVLGYDCDGNEINEFRILRFPFSMYIENWDEEPNVDPRLYCLVKSDHGEVFAISVYDDWHTKYIRKYEQLPNDSEVLTLIKTVSDMKYYEVAYDGITGKEWYYDRNKDELYSELNRILNSQKSVTRILARSNK